MRTTAKQRVINRSTGYRDAVLAPAYNRAAATLHDIEVRVKAASVPKVSAPVCSLVPKSNRPTDTNSTAITDARVTGHAKADTNRATVINRDSRAVTGRDITMPRTAQAATTNTDRAVAVTGARAAIGSKVTISHGSEADTDRNTITMRTAKADTGHSKVSAHDTTAPTMVKADINRDRAAINPAAITSVRAGISRATINSVATTKVAIVRVAIVRAIVNAQATTTRTPSTA